MGGGRTSPRRRCQRIAAAFNAKARRLAVPGVVTGEMLAALPWACFYCEQKGKHVYLDIMEGTWDHKIPFDRGGSNEITNIARCCLDCQRRKFTKTPEEFAAHETLTVVCALPGCKVRYQPRWAEWNAGRARYCSRAHAAASRWISSGSSGSSTTSPRTGTAMERPGSPSAPSGG